MGRARGWTMLCDLSGCGDQRTLRLLNKYEGPDSCELFLPAGGTMILIRHTV